jgi:hypothetical protein
MSMPVTCGARGLPGPSLPPNRPNPNEQEEQDEQKEGLFFPNEGF